MATDLGQRLSIALQSAPSPPDLFVDEADVAAQGRKAVRRRAAGTAAAAAGIAAAGVGLAWGALSSPEHAQFASPVETTVSEAEFDRLVQEELPGAFKHGEGKVPVAFFAKLNCGALYIAMHPEEPRSPLPPNAPEDLYDDPAHTRERLIDLWAEDVTLAEAESFVDLSLNSFCPDLARAAEGQP